MSAVDPKWDHVMAAVPANPDERAHLDYTISWSMYHVSNGRMREVAAHRLPHVATRNYVFVPPWLQPVAAFNLEGWSARLARLAAVTHEGARALAAAWSLGGEDGVRAWARGAGILP